MLICSCKAIDDMEYIYLKVIDDQFVFQDDNGNIIKSTSLKKYQDLPQNGVYKIEKNQFQLSAPGKYLCKYKIHLKDYILSIYGYGDTKLDAKTDCLKRMEMLNRL